jgi:hypothetical protein
MNLFGLMPEGLAQAFAQQDPEEMQTQMQPEPRKGMFGIKGTFRDILGTLGDAFLMQQGIDPMYRGERKQEEMGDAFQGFEDNPMAAIKRIGGVDAGVGQKYYNSYLDSQDRGKTLEQKRADDSFKQEGLFATRLGGVFGAANEKTYPAMLANAKKRAGALGFGHVLEGLPETYDKAAVSGWVRGTMEPKDQAFNDYRKERLDDFDATREEQVRANNAREGTAARNAGTAEGRLQTSKEKLKADEEYREWRKKNPLPTNTKGKSSRAPAPNIPPPPVGFKVK